MYKRQILLYLGYPPEGLARTTTTRVLHALRMPVSYTHLDVYKRQAAARVDRSCSSR